MNQLVKGDYREQLLESIKDIDTTSDWNYEEGSITKVIEEQKVYFWIRLYLTENSPSVEVGSDITICHKPNRSEEVVEELETKFICFGKKNMDRDYEGEITGYNSEDDEKCLCLMIDSSKVNFSDEIPFIRTLFKTGYHYEYQIMRRT